MNITFRQLEVFEVVARLLSYTKASKELHLSQPAVSMQIKQLEENMGLPLLEQVGRKTYLTEAGNEMYHYCRTIAQQLDEAEEVLEQLKGLKSGRLEITVATTANALATRMLSKFNKQYEGSTVRLDVTNRERLLRQLANNDKDIAIMGRPPEDADLVTEPFAENPLVVIAAPDAMRVVGALGPVLGPRGLMPNPKVGTVTADVETAVKNAKAGQVRYRTDKAGIIHCAIGRDDFEVDALKENLEALLVDLKKSKPASAKGSYFKKLTVSSTMGPGVAVDRASIDA